MGAGAGWWEAHVARALGTPCRLLGRRQRAQRMLVAPVHACLSPRDAPPSVSGPPGAARNLHRSSDDPPMVMRDQACEGDCGLPGMRHRKLVVVRYPAV